MKMKIKKQKKIKMLIKIQKKMNLEMGKRKLRKKKTILKIMKSI